jgi:tricorn protease
MRAIQCSFFIFCLAVSNAFSEPTLMLSHPDIHGDTIVFAYGGDLWSVSSQGGSASRLTTSEGVEMLPFFSPDGQTIAFTGEYDGRQDIYVIPAKGGTPKRLTFHPQADMTRGWTPDGTQIVFSTFTESLPRSINRLATISVEGGMPTPLPFYAAYDGTYSDDGNRMALVPVAPAFAAWRHYRGGRTTAVMITTMADLSQIEIPRNNSNDHNPLWIDDTVYFLSDRNGTMNLYKYDNSSVNQVTLQNEFDIKTAGSDGKRIVYAKGGAVNLFDPAEGQPTLLDIEINGDFPWARPQHKLIGSTIRDARLSPTGARAVIEARGEIITVPAEKGSPRNLTNSPGVHDRSPAWSPDGSRIAWFADKDGEYYLAIADQSGLEDAHYIGFQDPSFYYRPTWSPDSSHIVFTDKHLNVWLVNVEEETLTKVDTDGFSHPERTLNPVWSPDSKWIAYARRLDNQQRAIFVYSLEEEKSTQITDGLSDTISPAFDRSGKYIYFLASTNYGLNIGWLDMTSFDREIQRGIYVAVLAKDTPSPFLPESDEEEVKEEKEDVEEKAEENEEDTEDEDTKSDEEEKKDDEKDDSVTIDFDGLDQRILAIEVPVRNYVGLTAGPENMIFYAESVANQPGLTLHKYDMEKKEKSVFISGINGLDVSADGKKLLYRTGNTLSIVKTAGKAKNGDGKINTSSIKVKVDPKTEWKQIFHEAWRVTRDFFYDETLHGVDWPAMRNKYEPFLEHIHHRNDLTTLLNWMSSETVAGHTRNGGGNRPRTDYTPVGMLGADYEIENDRFKISKIYTGENWNPNLRAPLSAPGIDANEGDYLIAINGTPVPADNIYRHFEGLAGKQTVLTLSANADGSESRDVTVVPTSSERGLRVRAWIEDNRRKVDELSEGKLAYVYLPDTSFGGYTNFNRYFYGQQDKQGAVIDERFNGGGSIADYLVELMDRPTMSRWATRDGKEFSSPNAALNGPKVLIIDQWAGSGGDYLPYLFKKRGIGTMVGKRTWGGLIGVYDYPVLMDGGVYTAPRVAIYSTEGEWVVENVGVSPDIEVNFTPADYQAGRDPQLERAVEVALGQLQTNPNGTVERPKPINRMWRE